eukprot:Phypoly_transcript_03309.p1 GENE.Phypoly_transcript_03309~~Phypoly_transcript_03309.p1  ORF type:complete len:738 (+),score=125.55 Phypoly_transcript_03309:75-2288(+)
MRFVFVPLALLLFSIACWGEQPSMIKADDLAKEELFLLGSFPQMLSGIKAVDVYAGGYQSAVITDKGEVYYWGLVANSGIEQPKKATFVNSEGEEIDNPKISQLALGGYHILAVSEDGKVYSMGRGEGGVLGREDESDSPNLREVEGLQKRKVKLASAGYAHSIALADTGLFTWGSGDRGQLGSGTTKGVNTPKLTKMQGLSAKHITEICTGGYHTAVLNDAGEVYTFGGNSFGALGHGHKNDLLVPTLVKELKDSHISHIACGGDHTLALTRDGDVYSWGWGEKGQLGSGGTDDLTTPHKIDFPDLADSGDKIVSITAGGYATSFAVTEKGRVYAFGWGEFGILGNGGNENLHVPTLIPGLSNVKKIATGYKHAIALTQNGDVYVFGEDTYGSLGLGGEEAKTNSIPSPSLSPESLFPTQFGAIPPSDPAAERRNATINSWKAKGLNETSGKLIFSPTSGFVGEGNGRQEITLANAWAVGVSQQAKAPDNMEDFAIVIDRFGKGLDDGFTRVFFGVYDGHNGKTAAEFVAATFHKTLLQELQNKNQTTGQAFTAAYEYTNLVLNELAVPLTGTTAMTCLSVRNGTHHSLYSANVGDSRAILSRSGKAHRLSYDHKATDEQEVQRVESIGGEISNNRVAGVLAITRALGDTALTKKGVIATPFVSERDVLPLDDEYLILASDGLWDVISDQEAAEIAHAEQDAQKASKKLMKTALERGSKDDITVVAARVVRPLFLG